MNFDVPNTLPLLLLVIAATIGGLDILYYHVYKFRLYEQPKSRWEVVTHILRGILIGTGGFMLVNFEIRGAWYYVVGSLFILDFINALWDVYLEPESRAPLGGLPPFEYMIHIFGATMSGAISMSYFILFWEDRTLPTSLSFLGSTAFPTWLKYSGLQLAYGALLLTILDAGLLIRSHIRTKKVTMPL